MARKLVRDKYVPKLKPSRNMIPLPHMVYDVKEARYREVLPPTDPKIKIMVQVELQSYSDRDRGILASFFKKTGDQKWELDKSRPGAAAAHKTQFGL